MTLKKSMVAGTSLLACTLILSPAWADPDKGYGGHGVEYGGKSGHGDGYGRGGHSRGAGMMEMMMHGGAGHLIRHLLKHEKDIGLNPDQVVKLKDTQLNLDKTRIKMEADIQVAERELKALIEDEKSDMGAMEAKIKQSEDIHIALRLTSIKTRRDVLALLTPEQRAKEQAEHEKVMQQHKSMGSEKGKGPGDPHQKMAPANPRQSNPHGEKKAQ